MRPPSKDYYSILEIDRNADINEIRKAYRRLVKKYHPDMQQSPSEKGLGESNTEKFQSVLEAYRVLSDPKLKGEYDQTLPTFSGYQRVKAKKDHTDETIKNRAERLYQEGMEAYRMGDYNRAIEFLQICANLVPTNARYLSSLGIAYSKKKRRLHEARDWCEKAIKLEPYNANYYVNLAIVYKEAGLNKLAQRYFDQALKLDPENKRAKEGKEGLVKSNMLKEKFLSFMQKAFKKEGNK